jgi:hypothetical protein
MYSVHADFHRKSCCSPYNFFSCPGCGASDPEPNPQDLKIGSGYGNQFWIHLTEAEGRTGCRSHETSQEINICSYTVNHGGKNNTRPVKYVATAHIYIFGKNCHFGWTILHNITRNTRNGSFCIQIYSVSRKMKRKKIKIPSMFGGYVLNLGLRPKI